MNKRVGRETWILSLANVGVSYQKRTGFFTWKRFWALKDVSLELYHGETLGIIGRNGAGKSTLLQLLAGIIVPERGRIARNEYHASLLSLQVGFVNYLTGRENAILSGMLLGLRRREIEAKIDEIIDFAELESFIDDPVQTYSTGMRARLGFAVAFQVDPDILLVDEVLGVGDAEFKKKSTEAMRKKIRSNKTVVLVSHDPQTIKELCDRVVWIEEGQTVEEGNAELVLRSYGKRQQVRPKVIVA